MTWCHPLKGEFHQEQLDLSTTIVICDSKRSHRAQIGQLTATASAGSCSRLVAGAEGYSPATAGPSRLTLVPSTAVRTPFGMVRIGLVCPNSTSASTG